MKCRLKELREKHGLNQTGMALILNVSQQTISRMEAGSFRMPVDLAVKAAAYFKVSVDYFLGLTESSSYTPGIGKTLHNARKCEEFMWEYESLNPVHQRVIAKMVHQLLESQNQQSE